MFPIATLQMIIGCETKLPWERIFIWLPFEPRYGIVEPAVKSGIKAEVYFIKIYPGT